MRGNASAVTEVAGTPDYRLVEMTDEKLEEQAGKLVKRAHAEKLREIEKRIAAIQWP